MIQELVTRPDYDTWLYCRQANNQRNADLYIVVRAHLTQYNPPGGTGMFSDQWNTNVPVVNWPADAWNNFRRRFKPRLEEAFANTLWLVPSCFWGYDFFNGSTFRPNVKCNLRIDMVDSASQAQMRVVCPYPAPGSWIRPSMATSGGTISASHLTDESTQCGPVQSRAPHELGHYLGLRHVGANAPGCVTGGEMICYCPTPSDAGDLLGAGNSVRPWHAEPWLRRIVHHLPDLQRFPRWRVTQQRPSPVNLGPPYVPGGQPVH